MKKNLAFLLFLFLPYFSFAQIVIEERVEILPEGVNTILPFGSISGDSRNPTYLVYGGDVTLRTIHSSNPNLELWEESLGRLTITGTTSIGTFPQWHKFIFYLLDPSTGTKYYPEPGDLIVGDWGSATIDFYPSHQPGDPYPFNPEDWWEIEVSADYSLAAMPPEEILNYFGNPFQPTEPMEVAVDGNLYAVITYVGYDNFTQQDELWIDVPGVQLIQDNIGNFEYETFDLGHMTAGDSVRFFLRTQNSIVSGMNLYPKQIREEIFMPDGDILLWRLEFEDWTDLQFDDVEVEIYLTPDSLGSYPGPLEVTIEPVEIAPGDTADVVIKRRYLDGTLEDYPLEQLFEIGMIDGCEGGMILVDTTLDVYFEEVMQPIKFVAASSVTESDTVGIRVGLVEEIIGLSSININNLNDAKNEAAIKKERRLKLERIKKEKGTINPQVNNPTSFCFSGFFNSSTLDDGNVVVEAEEYTILLGETKYYQAKYNELEEKLEIVEIEAQLTGVSQNEGPVNGEEGWIWVTENVWGTAPISPVVEDIIPAVYWEKKYPIYINNPGGNNHRDYVGSEELDNGLVRVVGRFWRVKEQSEDEEQYNNVHKVKLEARYAPNGEEKIASLTLSVKKPSRLGIINNTLLDVYNHQYNLDSLIMIYSGKLGIPPQFIKADIQTESDEFNPSYRWEPFFDSYYLQLNRGTPGTSLYMEENFQYRISGMQNTGHPDIPTDHINVSPINYPGYVGTIWEFFFQNCRTVNPAVEYDIYRISSWYEIPNTMWSEIYVRIYNNSQLNGMTEEASENLAREQANEWLRYRWQGGIMNTGIAQTRTASSYGLLQILYTTAVDYRDYPIDDNHLPEYLQINEILFDNAVPYLKTKLAEQLEIDIENTGWEETINRMNNFELGLEETYLRTFNRYNGADEENEIIEREYGLIVMHRNKKYDPILD